MQILTKSEYDEMVEATVDQIFDPMSDDDKTRQFALNAIERIGEGGNNDEVRSEIRERIHRKVMFDHGLETDGFGAIDGMSAATAGTIVEHSQSHRVIRSEVKEMFSIGDTLARENPDKAVVEAAIAAFGNDVFRKTYERVRAAIADDIETDE